MSVTDNSPATLHAGVRLIAPMRGLFARAARQRRIARLARLLAALPDRTLRDIGLDPEAIDAAAEALVDGHAAPGTAVRAVRATGLFQPLTER
ncbi:MAG: DUF1127 domain-containing protein [Pseudomonadota bacterium]